MARPLRSQLSRRTFLATAGGAAAGAVLLGACGGDDDTDAEDPGTTTPTGDLVLVPYLSGPLFATGLVNRVPFGVADSQGLLAAEDTPAEVEITVLGPDGRKAFEPVSVERHVKGLERAYFPLEVEVGTPGIYTARADLGGPAAVEMAFEVKDASEVVVPKAGDAFPAVVTPTAADARGIDPVCTADPPCPYHAVTGADALSLGKPMALLVATPKFCKTFACGPVHQVFVDVLEGHPEVTGVHVEVYLHPNVNTDEYVPTITDLKLFLEPCLFLVGSDGKVVERLDAIYDEAELDAALSSLS